MYRRLIQKEALITINPDDLMHTISSLGWLWSNEDDLIYHLERILIEQVPHKESIWSTLVSWVFANPWLTGAALNFAQNQSKGNHNLEIIFNEIQSQRKKNKGIQVERQKELERKKKKSIKDRHKSYFEIADSIRSGENIGALHQIATAYLGRYSNIPGDTPNCRINELTGFECIEFALEGICAAIEHTLIPSVTELITADANNIENRFKSLLICYVDLCLSRGMTLSSIPKNILCSTLASFHWGDGMGLKLNIPDLQRQLEQFLFNDSCFKEQFLIDTIEPYLNNNSNYVPGLYRIKSELDSFEIIGKLAVHWLIKYPSLNAPILSDLLKIAICKGDHNQLLPFIRERVTDTGLDENLKSIWIAVSILLDFDNYHQTASILKEHIWALSTWMFGEQRLQPYWPRLTENQLFFFISTFGPLWQPMPYPVGELIDGNENPWDASKHIINIINSLSLIRTKEANNLLLKLLNNPKLIKYSDDLKHAYIESTRASKEPSSLQEVRSILLNKKPLSHIDLQTLILEMLQHLQNKIVNGQTSDYRNYWQTMDKKDSDNPVYIPHEENYCRDRITSHLEDLFDKYGIHVQPEGTRSSDKRCDLLVIAEHIAIPIEIKGQWHKDVYSAANSQLQNYTKEPRADGYGVYVVLWFGECTKMPTSYKGKRPLTFDEMNAALEKCYINLPHQTQWFVMDLSKRDIIKKKA
ncbi:TPA: hypothetical protein JA969_12475 [Legionella pneumophila]|nr:hypothetical protein [Legionella pneumophila]HAT8583834.1 hypothetical protein [Legionella pneumophila]